MTFDHACPFCGTVLHSTAPVGKIGEPKPSRKPKAGALLFCGACGEWMIFVARHVAPRRPTAEEYEAIVGLPMCRAVRSAWVQVMKERANGNDTPANRRSEASS